MGGLGRLEIDVILLEQNIGVILLEQNDIEILVLKDEAASNKKKAKTTY